MFQIFLLHHHSCPGIGLRDPATVGAQGGGDPGPSIGRTAVANYVDALGEPNIAQLIDSDDWCWLVVKL